MKNIKVYLLIILSSFSCKDSNQKLVQYQSFKKNLNSEALSTFPISEENFGNPYILTAVYPSLKERKYSGLFITYKMENIDSFQTKLKKSKAKNIYEASLMNIESNYVIPDSLYNDNQNMPMGNPPIPSFNDNLNYLNEIVNLQKSKIWVFDWKKGDFFNKPYQDSDAKYSNKGYSTGLIADQSNFYITYWIIVW